LFVFLIINRGKTKKIHVLLKENICVVPNHFVILMTNITSLFGNKCVIRESYTKWIFQVLQTVVSYRRMMHVFIHAHSGEFKKKRKSIYMYIISERCHGPCSALHAPRRPLCYTGLLSVKRIGTQITTDWNSGEWCIAYCIARQSEQAVTYVVRYNTAVWLRNRVLQPLFKEVTDSLHRVAL